MLETLGSHTNLVRGMVSEATGAPFVGISAVGALARSLIFSHSHSFRGVRINFYGGAVAIPEWYHRWKEFLMRTIPNPPPMYLPPKTITGVEALRTCLEEVPIHPGLDVINVGHSIGGIACLMDLERNPKRVRKVVLAGTPVHPELLHPLLRKLLIEKVLGINTSNLPPFLEQLKDILVRPELLKKIVVLAGERDRLFPPESCRIDGAEFNLVKRTTHLGLITKKPALLALHRVVMRAIGPRYRHIDTPLRVVPRAQASA